MLSTSAMPLASAQRLVPLSQQDAPALQQLYEQCSEYMVLVTGAVPDPTEAQHLLQALPPGIAVEQKLVLGLRGRDSQLLGALDIIQAFPREGTWYIGEFILAPRVRGLGMGRALYRAVKEKAETAGASSIELAVHEGNAGALAFWLRMGFEETGRSKYRIKELESTFVLMRALL